MQDDFTQDLVDATLDNMTTQIQNDKKKFDTASQNITLARADLQDMQTTYSGFDSSVDAWASADSENVAKQAAKARKDNLVTAFTTAKRPMVSAEALLATRGWHETDSDITVNYVSADHPLGTGTLTVKSADSMAWTPNGGSEGVTVTINNGETRVFPGSDESEYVVVTRDTAGDLSGTYDVIIYNF